MSSLAKFKSATSLTDVARLLGYKPSSLAYVLYKLPPEKKYAIFEIPKKSGGKRQITAPDKQLKNLQRSLTNILGECRAEIESMGPKRTSLSHGFKKGHSILTNARPHAGRRYVLNLDLKDFFPSLNFGRVRGFFIKNKDFVLNEKAATIVAQIACHNNALPQGSPCSPIISDLLTHILDVRLARLAKKNKCTFSRYADDITFSTNQKIFPAALAEPTKKNSPKWKLGQDLEKEIISSGFATNPDKTRMQYGMSRQTVTGLVVNKKVNVKAEYYRTARSMCRSLFKTGKYKFKGSASVTDVARLQGQLSHVYQVKFSELMRSSGGNRDDAKKRDKAHGLKGWQKLHSRFLFYRNFVALERPLILCEGTTDNIYSRSAIQSAMGKHSSLATVVGGKSVLAVSFFRYHKQSEYFLRLDGGSDKLRNFIAKYTEDLEYFEHSSLKHPVVILIDNDKGAPAIFSLMDSKFRSKVSWTTTAPFYPICSNLILVKTPESASDGVSKIEDFFSPDLLDVKLNGKVFSTAAKIDPSKEYGKTAFAENVVVPNKAKIDFSKFAPLLDRVEKAINSYKPPI